MATITLSTLDVFGAPISGLRVRVRMVGNASMGGAQYLDNPQTFTVLTSEPREADPDVEGDEGDPGGLASFDLVASGAFDTLVLYRISVLDRTWVIEVPDGAGTYSVDDPEIQTAEASNVAEDFVPLLRDPNVFVANVRLDFDTLPVDFTEVVTDGVALLESWFFDLPVGEVVNVVNSGDPDLDGFWLGTGSVASGDFWDVTLAFMAENRQPYRAANTGKIISVQADIFGNAGSPTVFVIRSNGSLIYDERPYASLDATDRLETLRVIDARRSAIAGAAQVATPAPFMHCSSVGSTFTYADGGLGDFADGLIGRHRVRFNGSGVTNPSAHPNGVWSEAGTQAVGADDPDRIELAGWWPGPGHEDGSLLGELVLYLEWTLTGEGIEYHRNTDVRSVEHFIVRGIAPGAMFNVIYAINFNPARVLILVENHTMAATAIIDGVPYEVALDWSPAEPETWVLETEANSPFPATIALHGPGEIDTEFWDVADGVLDDDFLALAGTGTQALPGTLVRSVHAADYTEPGCSTTLLLDRVTGEAWNATGGAAVVDPT